MIRLEDRYCVPAEKILEIREVNDWKDIFEYLAATKKPLRIRNGREFIIYFEIICYAIRLAVIETLGGKPDEERIREFYYTVHDWILEICYNKSEPLKSRVYKDAQSLKIFKEKIARLEG